MYLGKDVCSLVGTETPTNFLFDFYLSHSSFASIIIIGYREVRKKRKEKKSKQTKVSHTYATRKNSGKSFVLSPCVPLIFCNLSKFV